MFPADKEIKKIKRVPSVGLSSSHLQSTPGTGTKPMQNLVNPLSNTASVGRGDQNKMGAHLNADDGVLCSGCPDT